MMLRVGHKGVVKMFSMFVQYGALIIELYKHATEWNELAQITFLVICV